MSASSNTFDLFLSLSPPPLPQMRFLQLLLVLSTTASSPFFFCHAQSAEDFLEQAKNAASIGETLTAYDNAIGKKVRRVGYPLLPL